MLTAPPSEKNQYMKRQRVIELLATLYTAYRDRGRIGKIEEGEIRSVTEKLLNDPALIWRDRYGKCYLRRPKEEWEALKPLRKQIYG